jgi:hypothetical protein
LGQHSSELLPKMFRKLHGTNEIEYLDLTRESTNAQTPVGSPKNPVKIFIGFGQPGASLKNHLMRQITTLEG